MFAGFVAIILVGTNRLEAQDLIHEVRNSCAIPEMVENTITLNSSCIYKGSIVITRSQASLNCNGATIDANLRTHGILIKGVRLRNIVISNCVVLNAKKQGILIQAPSNDREMARMPAPERYAEATQGVRITGSTIRNAGSVGIYVDSYVQGTVIDTTSVTDSAGAGIYLEHSSMRTTIRNSVFIANGISTRAADKKRIRREAIAIDSSAQNNIVENLFSNNGLGGVFLYKNCQEHHQRPNSVRRWMHASYNTIAKNVFLDEQTGVWIASRQSRNLERSDCGDTPIAKGYFRDYADHNTVQDNKFIRNKVAIRIEDDYSRILGNFIFYPKISCVFLGSPKRDELLPGLTKSELYSNRCYKGQDAGAFKEIGMSTFLTRCNNFVNAIIDSTCR